MSWNQIVAGSCHSRMIVEARELFDRMKERNILYCGMVLISGYVEA